MDNQTTLPQERERIFWNELLKIHDMNLRLFVIDVLKEIPEYFFHIPASSTGKYHPQYALGEGGLVRHTKAAVGIALDLFNIEPDAFDKREQDCIIAALILHDGMKNGPAELSGESDSSTRSYTKTEHPILMANLIYEIAKRKGLDATIGVSSFPDVIVEIMNLIQTHMGRWTLDYKTKAKVLSEPSTKAQKLVHLADYLASRKHLQYIFD